MWVEDKTEFPHLGSWRGRARRALAPQHHLLSHHACLSRIWSLSKGAVAWEQEEG